MDIISSSFSRPLPSNSARWLLWWSVVGLLAGCALGTAQAGAAFQGWVVGVDDGDSLTLRVEGEGGGETRRVRLDGIDAPERHQPYADRARQQLRRLCLRGQAEVQVSGQDRYGRWLGQVRCRGGVWAQQAQLAAGLAWVYQAYVPADSPLWAIEAEARQARRGLWAEAQPVPPWQWRRVHPAEPRRP